MSRVELHHCVKCNNLAGDIPAPQLQNMWHWSQTQGHYCDTEVSAVLVLYPARLCLHHECISFSCCRGRLVLLAGLHAPATADKQRSPIPADGALPSPGQWWHQADCPISEVCRIQEWGCTELVGPISPGRAGTSKGARAAVHYQFPSKMKSVLASPRPSSNFQKAAVQEASKKGKKRSVLPPALTDVFPVLLSEGLRYRRSWWYWDSFCY